MEFDVEIVKGPGRFFGWDWTVNGLYRAGGYSFTLLGAKLATRLEVRRRVRIARDMEYRMRNDLRKIEYKVEI